MPFGTPHQTLLIPMLEASHSQRPAGVRTTAKSRCESKHLTGCLFPEILVCSMRPCTASGLSRYAIYSAYERLRLTSMTLTSSESPISQSATLPYLFDSSSVTCTSPNISGPTSTNSLQVHCDLCLGISGRVATQILECVFTSLGLWAAVHTRNIQDC